LHDDLCAGRMQRDGEILIVRTTRQMLEGAALFHRRRFKEALVPLKLCLESIDAVPAFNYVGTVVWYSGMTAVAACEKCPMIVTDEGNRIELPPNYNPKEINENLQLADKLIARVKVWADHNPKSYYHRWAVLKAERNHVAMHSHMAAESLFLNIVHLYEVSIHEAEKNGFLLEHALALELFARFLLRCSRTPAVPAMLRRVFGLYKDYGAHMPAQILAEEFGPSVLGHLNGTAFGWADFQVPLASAHEAESMANKLQGPLTKAQSQARAVTSASSTNSPTRLSQPTAAITPTSPLKGAMNSQASRTGTGHLSDAAPSNAAVHLDAVSLLKATVSFSTEVDQSRLLRSIMVSRVGMSWSWSLSPASACLLGAL
jgi:hypothetical protein